MANYFCSTKLAFGKMIILFSPNNGNCETHSLASANEPAT